MNALFAWAKADALTETKPCAKNGYLLPTRTEWLREDGKDLSDKKDHSTTQMQMMHLAFGYYITLAGYRPHDPKHKAQNNSELDREIF